LSLAFQRADELQNYWSFYGTVVLALLGFFASLKADRRTLIFGAAFVSVAFMGVSLANLLALRDVSLQRLALQDQMNVLAGTNENLRRLANTITPSSVMAVTFFHLVVDAFTLISVWTLALHLPEAEQGRGK
jgi:hypothetical protein